MFLANLWDYRERVIPIRGNSPDMLFEIHRLGAEPDLIFLDADKEGREIEICHELFPNATMTGDDWWWGRDRWWRADKGYPIRKPVKDFCRQNRRFLKTSYQTWVIDDEPPTFEYQKTLPRYYARCMRRRFRALIGRPTKNDL
jgi:hypothetical protein